VVKAVGNAQALTNTKEKNMPSLLDPDQELLAALRERESTAAEALITAYGDRAYRLAARITGNQQDAEEAIQDAFWSVVRKIDTFRGDSAFGTWVYRIVSNAAYEKIRRRQGVFVDIALDEVLPPFHEGRHAGLISDWSSGIDDPAVQTELRSVLSSAVSELPAHYRAVLVLRDIEGLSMAEVADALGISVGTAKTRAHRARLFLRKRLADGPQGREPRGTSTAASSGESPMFGWGSTASRAATTYRAMVASFDKVATARLGSRRVE
jgi:RNA polymerase sigma-70 factor (ECF subfamily)